MIYTFKVVSTTSTNRSGNKHSYSVGKHMLHLAAAQLAGEQTT